MVLSVIDLFSGCGGMSTGFHRQPENFQIVGAVDRELAKPGRKKSKGSSTGCNPTYLRNIGVAPRNDDLASLDPHTYRQSLGLGRGELGVLISCAPCTGFSQKNAANHVGDDPRNRLVERTADFVAEFLPQFLAMENVKELLVGNRAYHFHNLAGRLRVLGYAVSAEVHNLAAHGLPQRRVRSLILARREGPLVGLSPGRASLRTVRQAIGHLSSLTAGERDPDDLMHVSPGVTPPVLARIRAIPHDGGSWTDVMRDPLLDEEEKRRLLIPSMFRARPVSFPDAYGRLWWDKPAMTVTRECGHVGNGRYTHPDQDRLLTVREMALLQGFPPDYHFEGTLTAKYNQIGDAVPPLISTLIAGHIARLASGDIAVATERAGRARQLALLPAD